MINIGLQSISLALICFLKDFVELPNTNTGADLHPLVCIVQVPIYSCRYDKAAVVTKTLVKSIS